MVSQIPCELKGSRGGILEKTKSKFPWRQERSKVLGLSWLMREEKKSSENDIAEKTKKSPEDDIAVQRQKR